MKKINKIILSLFILICICGCNKNGITGKYNNVDYKNGRLTLYENGSCSWTQITSLSHSEIEIDSEHCNYDYNDDEITLRTKGTYGFDDEVVTCSYSKNTIDCGEDGKYKKDK